jgi:hypothetical protein
MAAPIIKILLRILWLNTAPSSLQFLMFMLLNNFWCSVPWLIGVLEWYLIIIIETAKLMSGQLNTIYLYLANGAKIHWSHRWDLRLQHEQYLGNNYFKAERNRSCAEFTMSWSKYSLIWWYSIK